MSYSDQLFATTASADVACPSTSLHDSRQMSESAGSRGEEMAANDTSASAPQGVDVSYGRLAGTSALVTGAGGGIGRAVALELSSLGAEVCLVGRKCEALRETAEELRRRGNLGHVIPADLTRSEDVNSLLGEIRMLWTGVDALVHCAGAYSRGSIASTPVTELDRLYAANVQAPYRLTQLLLPMLVERRGYVVFVNSTQGLSASGLVGQFAATQHGLKAVADSLRCEVNAYGVRVLTLHVGRTATGRQREIFEQEGRDYYPDLLLQSSDVARTVAHCLTLPATAEVTNVTIRPALKSY